MVREDWTTTAQNARKVASGAAAELWNVRLDALRAAGDVRGMLAHLASPVESGCDNCSCNQGCNSCFDGSIGDVVTRAQER